MRRVLLLCVLGLTIGVPIQSLRTPDSRTRPAYAHLPAKLTDAEFWSLSRDLSEPPGSFRSENLVGNETMYEWVIPELTRRVAPGGVYLGVAPDQNFTYIAALHPAIAFIVDIRRGNLIELLLYKAIIELSPDRASFLSRLFSRPMPAGLGPRSTAEELVHAFAAEPGDHEAFAANERAVLDLLERRHGFDLSSSDEDNLRWIYNAFFTAGPDLTYSSGGTYGTVGRSGVIRRGFGRGFGFGRMFPTYGDMQMESDGNGVEHSYLADAETYRYLREFEAKNLIVPVTGDFAGPKALRAVGEWVRGHGATVSTFYTSNVEQYLFQGESWRPFYANVATLPLDPSSTFIRSVPSSFMTPAQPGAHAASLLCSMQQLVKAFKSGSIQSYFDVIAMSR